MAIEGMVHMQTAVAPVKSLWVSTPTLHPYTEQTHPPLRVGFQLHLGVGTNFSLRNDKISESPLGVGAVKHSVG